VLPLLYFQFRMGRVDVGSVGARRLGALRRRVSIVRYVSVGLFYYADLRGRVPEARVHTGEGRVPQARVHTAEG